MANYYLRLTLTKFPECGNISEYDYRRALVAIASPIPYCVGIHIGSWACGLLEFPTFFAPANFEHAVIAYFHRGVQSE